LILPLYFVVPTFGNGYEKEPLVILSSFLLIHVGTGHSVLYVAWTLYQEAMFYAAFAVALVSRGAGIALAILATAAAVAELTVGPFPGLLDFYASPLHIVFLIGIAAAWVIRDGYLRRPALLIGTGMAVFAAAAFTHVGTPYPAESDGWSLAFGFGAAMMLVGLVQLEQSGRIRVPAALRLIGDASYSIYLTHQLTMSILAKVIGAIHRYSPILAAFDYIAITAFAVLVGVGLHLVVERPLLRLLSAPRRQASASNVVTIR
jgi:peptidoglycan/LPS O-acetylase OafA/YrhL